MMATGVTMVQTPGAQITVVSPTVVRRAPVGLCAVGALLSVVSLSTTGWMEGNIAPGVKVSSGLWSSCVTMSSAGFGGSTTQCTSYNIKDLAAVIHATRFFALVGFFASVVSVALAVAISKVRVWVLVEARRGHGHTDARRERAQSTKDCASVNFWWPFFGLSLLHVRWGRGACGCFHPPRKDSGRAHGFSLGGVWCLTLAWGVRARKGEGAVINQTVKTVCWRGPSAAGVGAIMLLVANVLRAAWSLFHPALRKKTKPSMGEQISRQNNEARDADRFGPLPAR